MRISINPVQALSQVTRETYSLDILITGEGEEPLKDMLSGENTPVPSTSSDELLRHKYLGEWVSGLPTTECSIIEMRSA